MWPSVSVVKRHKISDLLSHYLLSVLVLCKGVWFSDKFRYTSRMTFSSLSIPHQQHPLSLSVVLLRNSGTNDLQNWTRMSSSLLVSTSPEVTVSFIQTYSGITSAARDWQYMWHFLVFNCSSKHFCLKRLSCGMWRLVVWYNSTGVLSGKRALIFRVDENYFIVTSVFCFDI
jgi:hypothetical protein